MHKNGTTNVGSASHKVDEKIDELSERVKGLFDQGAQKVDAIRSKVVEAKDRTIQRSSDMLDQGTDLIKAHPVKAVIIAFSIGYLGMRLFRR
jgi:ElaB/YqjD/DUF883 family membrane-anchored ribosome-binding protein